VPGAVLESWIVAGYPSNPVTSVKDTLGLQLVAGTQYWVEMATTQPDGNGLQTFDQWNESLSATGTISLLNPDSTVTGYPVGNAANAAFWNNLNACGLSCGSLWVPAFDVLGQTASIPIPHFVGGALGQTIQELVGPAPLGLSVEVNLGFVGPDGNSIGPNSTVTLGPGETAPLDLNVDTLVQAFGQRVEVRPVVTVVKVTDVSLQPVNLIVTPAVALREVTEVFDTSTGFGTVLVPGKTMFPPNPIFELQGLAWEQTMRLIVSADPPNPCAATLGFVDSKGSPMGQSMQVDLKPGDTEWLDLNANTLGLKLGQRVEVQPIVTMTSPASSCQASVEVFDDVSGRTWTHQDPGSGGAQNLPNLPIQN
jgi:hypothetical protein